jgi:DNA-binding MarR family transcriptional regulator
LSYARLVDVKASLLPRLQPRSDVAAFEQLTRALIGVTLESLDALDGTTVTIPQFRVLLALDGLGRAPSSALAARMGVAASSVTRSVDRLQTTGLVMRGTDKRSRSIVTVELTRAGRDLVTRVLARRHTLFEAVLDAMTPAERAAAADAATRFARLANEAVAIGPSGPVPL